MLAHVHGAIRFCLEEAMPLRPTNVATVAGAFLTLRDATLPLHCSSTSEQLGTHNQMKNSASASWYWGQLIQSPSVATTDL